MKIFVVCITSIAILFSTMGALASETCEDTLSKCNDALNAELDLNKSLTQVNDNQAALIAVLNTDVAQEEKWKPIALGAIGCIALESAILILRK